MNDSALEHRLVRDYLRELDLALTRLPEEQASELKEQLTAHLEEVISPGAEDQEIAAALRQLGSPAALVAEASLAPAGPADSAGPRGTAPARLARAFLISVRPRTWVILAVVIIGLVVAGRVADHYWSAYPLSYTGDGDWWYHQDAKHEHVVSTDTQAQNTTPIRSGQRQGYVVAVYNGSLVTETIVGDASGPHLGWDNPGGSNEQIAVSRSYTDVANGLTGQAAAGQLAFGLPVAIPPLQTRLVRVLWTSGVCLSKGESNGIDDLYLRVRVGWFTRTQIIPQQEWDLIGPSHGRC
jgi:HAAS domain-containing protein